MLELDLSARTTIPSSS